MDTTQLLSILIQIPVVAAFMWFTLKIVNTFLDNITDQNGRWQKVLEQNTKSIERLTELAIEHDQRADEFIKDERARRVKAQAGD